MIIDTREPREYKDLWPDAKTQEMMFGDYASDDGCTIIERKQYADLCSSIVDGRYRRQIADLMAHPGSFIIVEGTADDLGFKQKTRQNIGITESAIKSIPMKYRIPLFRTDGTPEDFKKMLDTIMEKREDIHFETAALECKRHTKDPKMGLYLALPGVGVKKAKKLMEIYETGFASFVEDTWKNKGLNLKDLKGFGPKRSQNIFEALQ